MRRALLVVAAAVACAFAQPALAVTGAGYTTVNTAVDGSGHCKNGNPGVNCNIYDGKEFVWLNGGPAANGLGPDGRYFFAVLVPGGQPNPNDGGAKNLSDDYDAYSNRTFTVTNGEVSAYAGTHLFDSGAGGGAHPNGKPPFIRLFPYADTTNPGGVYIMAICSLGAGYPVVPRSCKYDAFKVQSGKGKVQAVLSGMKYLDSNTSGRFDGGEAGLSGWTIHISGTDGTNVDVLTDGAGLWSYTVPAHFPSAGTTTYTINEKQQGGWTQTGNTFNDAITAGGATAALANFVYTVKVPNDAVSAVEELDFGNVMVCPTPIFGVDATGHAYSEVTLRYPVTGLASIVYTYLLNVNVTTTPSPWAAGTTNAVVVRGTQADTSQSYAISFDAYDTLGNRASCDPAAGTVVRENGASEELALPGVSTIDRYATIYNGSPGVSGVDVNVNGTVFHLRQLEPGETRSVDISSAIVDGSNTVSAVARGAPGGSASVVISN
jgi:hypothetical protein